MTTENKHKNIKQVEKELAQAFSDYVEIAEQIHDLAVEIINDYINKNFKYESGDIILRKRVKLSNKWIVLITNMYNEGIIEYDKEKKKFIIHIQ